MAIHLMVSAAKKRGLYRRVSGSSQPHNPAALHQCTTDVTGEASRLLHSKRGSLGSDDGPRQEREWGKREGGGQLLPRWPPSFGSDVVCSNVVCGAPPVWPSPLLFPTERRLDPYCLFVLSHTLPFSTWTCTSISVQSWLPLPPPPRHPPLPHPSLSQQLPTLPPLGCRYAVAAGDQRSSLLPALSLLLPLHAVVY